uniref:TetR family transcriptional regulator n=1 Tax=Thaumasiovibrio occultus TaxID=1891184 RepID=UPI00131E5F06|nr:TetR family transcriptional regulator [Thaumasiovibrio occultus]
MARKRKEEAEKTRRLLIESALTVFAENGLMKSTLAQVASHAGLTRGAIYWHFKDKNDLLDALWSEIMAPYAGLFEKIEDTEESKLSELLIDIARLLLKEIKTNSRLQTVVKLHAQAPVDTSFLESRRIKRRDDHVRMEKTFARVEHHRMLQPHLSASEATVLYNAFIAGLYQLWINNPDHYCQLNTDNLITSLKLQLFTPAPAKTVESVPEFETQPEPAVMQASTFDPSLPTQPPETASFTNAPLAKLS